MLKSLALFSLLVPALTMGLPAQETPAKKEQKEPKVRQAADQLDVESTIQRCCEVLLSMQEGKKKDRWPYEGVYREGGKIPIGYRVGGTSIAGLALIEAAGYEADAKRKKAIKRSVSFLLKELKDPLMAEGFRGRYDVRGWGHTYTLLFFLRLQELKRVPTGRVQAVKKRTEWLIRTLQATEIPERGGWNYSRRRGYGDRRNAASPFMTGPTLQALFHAKKMGFKIDDEIVKRGLASLERGRTKSGGYSYTANLNVNEKPEDELSFMDLKPGSIGRMVVVEQTLALTDRGNVARLRDAIQSFFEHWKALKIRKQQNGTHIKPYGVAPYYFMYAHYYVARAIQMLPDPDERSEFEGKLRTILAREYEDKGGWNDRVFDRSRNYGTALGMMALMMGDIPKIPAWDTPTREDESSAQPGKSNRKKR